MNVAFPLRFSPAEEGGFNVQGIEPFDGVITCGETLDEARAMASEALALYIETALAASRAIPRPPHAEGGDIQWVEPEADVIPPLLVRWAREDAGLTQADMASRLGVKQQSYQRLESPGANPSIRTLARTLKAAGAQLRLST